MTPVYVAARRSSPRLTLVRVLCGSPKRTGLDPYAKIAFSVFAGTPDAPLAVFQFAAVFQSFGPALAVTAARVFVHAAPTVVALQWLALHRAELAARWGGQGNAAAP